MPDSGKTIRSGLLTLTRSSSGAATGCGRSATTSAAFLSPRRPRKLAWRTTLSAVNSAKATSATSSGFTQWAPPAPPRGPPPRAFPPPQRVEPLAQVVLHLHRKAGADLAGIAQLALFVHGQ